MVAKLKVGDEVVVISGRDKGQHGRIPSVDQKRECVVVGGVMMMKYHSKAGYSQQDGPTGGTETKEAAIHISNVMYYEPAAIEAKLSNTAKKIPGIRVGIREEVVDRDSKEKTVHVRVSKATGKDLQQLRQ